MFSAVHGGLSVNDLQVVQKRLKGLLLKRPGFALALCGPAGIGKTFTVRALLRETPCRNLSVHAKINPSKLLQALPRPKKIPVWLERVFKRLEVGEFVEAKLILDAISTSLIAAAPFVLHLEDLHELAEDQLGFVAELAAVIGRLKGVGLLVTSRIAPPEVFEGNLETVYLEVLSDADVTVMLERDVGAVLPVEAITWIHARAAGNPLFTLEFLRHLSRQGFVWSDGQRWHWREPPGDATPVTVEILIEQGLVAVLNVPEFVAVLSAGSLIPNGLMQDASGLWAAMAQMTPAIWRDSVGQLEQRGVLLNAWFTHPLFPEVIRHGLSATQRQQLAQRAIQHLETEHPQLAVLFLEPARLEPEAALSLLERAWTQADAFGDELRAARLIVQASRIAPRAQGISLALDAAKRLSDLETYTALEMLDWVLKLEPDNAQAMLLRARTLVFSVKFAQAEEAFEQLPVEVRTSHAGQETWFEMICRADKKRLVRYWDEHPEARTRFELIAPRIFAHVDQIETEQAIELAQTALSNPNLTDDWLRAKILNALAGVYRSSYRFEEADEVFTQTLELLEHKLGGRQAYIVRNNRALARQALGQLQEARSDLESCILQASEVRETSTLALALGTLADLEMDAGRYERAEDLLRQARELLEPLELHRHHVDIEDSSCELYVNWPGQAYTGMLALKHGRHSLRMARSLESLASVMTALIQAGKAEAQFGQIETAHAIANELDEMYDPEMGIPYHEVSWIRALIFERQGQPAQALEQYRLARQSCVQINRKAIEYILDVEVARLAQETELAHAALQWFEERKMYHYSNRVKHFFPELSTRTIEPVKNTTSNSTSRLEVLGPMRILRDQQAQPVRGRKRQELLAFLLEQRIAGHQEVSKLDLIDALYPDTDETQANANLKETVRAIRAQFGTDVIQTQGNSYSLGEIGSDAETFLRTGDTSLWRGAYLEGEALFETDGFARENLHVALLGQAQTILETNPEETLRVGKILLVFDVFNLEHLELCVRALQLRNNHKSLNRLYADARNQLLEVAEHIPERWQDFLADRAANTSVV
jgi:DNA-binding SARP family transcriptional activator